jgi:hypothetical protein
MKKILAILFYLPILFSCVGKKDANKNTKIDVNICRCLTESGNSDWAKENGEDCDKQISKEIGVTNWKSVNFSQNANLSAKWDKMVNDCVNNQLENDSKESSSQEISFEEAKVFMQERFENIGQTYLNGKTTYHNGGDFKVYYFISQSIQYSEYYCLASVSCMKLEVLESINCGKNEIITEFQSQ